MSAPFRFALVGSGNISNTYARAIANIDAAEIVAVVSRSGHCPEALQDRSVELAETLAGIAAPFDAVILATPNGLHGRGAVAAAALGKHVLTEKVLDVTRAAMDEMMAACRQAGVKLGVTFQRRMSPDNRIVKDLLDRNAFGKLYAADLSAKFYRGQDYYDSGAYRGTRDLDGGGPFIQQAAHNLDIYTWFFGLPDKVGSVLGTLGHAIDVEDHGAAVLRYENGMIGTIIASTVCVPGFDARLEIHGEKGSVTLVNDEITQWHLPGMENPSRAGDITVHSAATSVAVSDTEGHEAIIRDFVDAVQNDRDPAVTADSARMATELALRIYEAGI